MSIEKLLNAVSTVFVQKEWLFVFHILVQEKEHKFND